MSLPLPHMDPCFFCEILTGRVDRWSVIEQTALTATLLNGRQFEVGQCMVLPVRHAPTFLDLTAEEDAAVMAAGRRLMQAMIGAFTPDGILVYQNNGTGSLQEVPHFHMHIVPRRHGSEWGAGPPHLARVVGADLQVGPDHVSRAPQFNHTVVTPAKRETVDALRGALGAGSR